MEHKRTKAALSLNGRLIDARLRREDRSGGKRVDRVEGYMPAVQHGHGRDDSWDGNRWTFVDRSLGS